MKRIFFTIFTLAALGPLVLCLLFAWIYKVPLFELLFAQEWSLRDNLIAVFTVSLTIAVLHLAFLALLWAIDRHRRLALRGAVRFIYRLLVKLPFPVQKEKAPSPAKKKTKRK